MHLESITTPFGRRRLTHAQLKHQATASSVAGSHIVDKWKVFRHIAEARSRLGLQDRALAVLNALLSFLPGTDMDPKAPLVVFPSNEQLSLRAHGVCARTLRRSIASLVEAGLICRNDSPNGKRYAHRSRSGEIEYAYGFDLRPMALRAAEFAELAAEIVEEAIRLKRTREAITICRRDLRKLLQFYIEETRSEELISISLRLDEILAHLPRKAAAQNLEASLRALKALRSQLLNVLNNIEKSNNSSANEGQSDRHKEESESESHIEKKIGKLCGEKTQAQHRTHTFEPTVAKGSRISLDVILKTCPKILECSPAMPIRDLMSLSHISEIARVVLGIDKEQYLRCVQLGGELTANILVCIVYQRQEQIRSPGAYFCELLKLLTCNRLDAEKLVLSMLKRSYDRSQERPVATEQPITVSHQLLKLCSRPAARAQSAEEKRMVRITSTN
ncbi:plasmid replication protein RepC [Rhizobium sp. FKY42]|uniref:plasmid replication protein RepC n=1 Tax=Rhizobium sp. FKY42 TaxID=2562310 RepID=UPI0010C0BEBD|nr:plasmid replication protein RepC [Rhizobium sp. FKY42]